MEKNKSKIMETIKSIGKKRPVITADDVADALGSVTIDKPVTKSDEKLAAKTKKISGDKRTGSKKYRMTGDASDSDSEEELMEYMYMRRAHHPPTPRMVMKMEDRGMSRRMIKELMYGHPAHYRDEYRLKGIDGWNPNAVINKTGSWQDPIGLGYTKSGGWKDPEPEDIPQTQPLNDKQVKNNAGGYGYQVDDLVRVRRMMCLGTTNGTYYKNTLELTLQNTQAVASLLENKRGEDLVQDVVMFSNGRAAKMNSLLFVLAMCARQSDHLSTKRAAYKALSSVCRIPTHLFIFMEYYNQLSVMQKDAEKSGSGWGRAHRIGIANWYLNFKDNPFKLALHVTKYRQRNGWSHRDVIRLSHPKNSDRGSTGLGCVLKYVVKGLDSVKVAYPEEEADNTVKKILTYLEATEAAKKLTINDIDTACEMIAKHRLVREHLPTELLNSVPVWRALLQEMPMTALIRNLGKMTNIGLLNQGSTEAALAIEKLTNQNQLKGARIHPFNVLLAYHQYNIGHGDKSNLTWNPNPDITASLEKAFDLSFKFVEPTNKRFCIALDISGSMDFKCANGTPIKTREAAAAMSMVTIRSERRHRVIGFHNEMIQLNMKPTMNLREVLEESSRYGFGGTDCAKPMLWATENKMRFDAFIIYTDCETHSGSVHPTEALRRYRLESGIPDAKLIVVAMTSNGFTIADPNDHYMLDVIGFDSNAPEIMSKFVLGEI